jgi:hypothetical protein
LPLFDLGPIRRHQHRPAWLVWVWAWLPLTLSCSSSALAPSPSAPVQQRVSGPRVFSPAPGPEERVPADLIFAGSPQGRVTNAVQTLCSVEVTPATRHMFMAGFYFSLGGQRFLLSIEVAGYEGPGRYVTNRVPFDPTSREGTPSVSLGQVQPGRPFGHGVLAVGSPQVVVNPNGRSGTLTAKLPRRQGDQPPATSVSGSWRCSPVSPLGPPPPPPPQPSARQAPSG